jgi:hypothetical protein
MFSIGWIAYFAAEVLSRSRPTFSPSLIVVGHLLCAVALVALARSDQIVPILSMWFLTGVGGGTAYTLSNGPQAPNRERAEDVGHVVGALVGGVLATLASVPDAIYVAAFVAFATAISAQLVRTQLRLPNWRHACA